jgi:hypothetical protein
MTTLTDSVTYIARVLNGLLVGCGLKFSGARWSSADVFTDPPQTRNISGTRTRKSAGENQKPNPKPENRGYPPRNRSAAILTDGRNRHGLVPVGLPSGKDDYA